MTREEADRLLAAAGALHIRLYVALGRHTAARKSALLEMRWDAVDLGRGRISLGLGTGNKRRAVLPIVPPLMDELRCGVELRTSPFVVEHAGGPVKDIKTDFHAACRRAGLAGVTPHTLRHTAASWMAQGGTSMDMIASWLGDNPETVRRSTPSTAAIS